MKGYTQGKEGVELYEFDNGMIVSVTWKSQAEVGIACWNAGDNPLDIVPAFTFAVKAGGNISSSPEEMFDYGREFFSAVGEKLHPIGASLSDGEVFSLCRLSMSLHKDEEEEEGLYRQTEVFVYLNPYPVIYAFSEENAWGVEKPSLKGFEAVCSYHEGWQEDIG